MNHFKITFIYSQLQLVFTDCLFFFFKKKAYKQRSMNSQTINNNYDEILVELLPLFSVHSLFCSLSFSFFLFLFRFCILRSKHRKRMKEIVVLSCITIILNMLVVQFYDNFCYCLFQLKRKSIKLGFFFDEFNVCF